MTYEGHIAFPGPAKGDLLIAGSSPENWTLVATPRGGEPRCYGMDSQWAEETNTTVELDFGVTLQKAPDYDPHGRTPDMHRIIPQEIICLNREGQVFRIGISG